MKKGFAISGLVYSILVLFLILIFGILGILGSRKLILDKMKNDLIGQLNNELVNDIYIDDSGANYPRLTDKMIPVIYDNSKGSWVYANIYEKWYDYDDKMWANAVVLKNGVVKAVGQEIKEEEIALMYVWIPRFKYVMFNANNEEVEEQQIEVIFENNTNSTGTVKCVDAINQRDANGNLISEICTDVTNGTIVNNASTYTHPAFTFGDDEIEGFWVGKFENSTTDETCLNAANVDNCNKSTHVIEIKGSVFSLGYINVSNIFSSIQNINNNYSINNADSHMIKNMEWGAVAYLTQSKYGKCTNGVCKEVIANNVRTENNVHITGCSAGIESQSRQFICKNEYNTELGVNASTTGNVYGVYDMSGGSWEYVMSNMVDNNNNFNYNLSGFLSAPELKYYDVFSYNNISEREYTIGKLGDGTKEIIDWYDDLKHIVHDSRSWLARGGYSMNERNLIGIFAFSSNADFGYGMAYGAVGSRSILIKE